MKLRQIIESRISTLKLYDKHGKAVDTAVCQKEYYSIRNHLLSHYSEHDIVGIRFEKDYRYVLTLLACMSIELPYIPLSMEWPQERINQIAELSGCHVIEEEMFDYVDTDSSVSQNAFSNETLYIIFTSGSTGAPKGVKIPRSAYEDFLLWSGEYFSEITADDKMLLTTDFTFDISLVDISLLLMKNLTLYISNFNNNVFKLLYELETYKITTHSTVPYNYSMLMHENVYSKGDISSLKHVMIGGARFPNNLYASFKTLLPACDIYNFYGPTEATIYCAIAKFEYNKTELHQSNITIGKPFYNNEFTIIDDELFISGPQVMSGYLHNPTKTAEALVTIEEKLYYKSGDVVFINEAGNYFIVGRKDDTIKVTGYRVNLSDIDSYILQLGYISNVATVAIENVTTENDLVSYMILNDSSITTKQIKTDLKEIMPGYQIPKFIKIVEAFPLNNSGKICKLTLKQNHLDKK
jgi:acyl-coenzyme A synthetase/AMP-(fatty) acid ligase